MDPFTINKVIVIGLGSIALRHRKNLKLLFPDVLIIAVPASGKASNKNIQFADQIILTLEEAVKEKVDIVHPKAKAGDLEDQYYNDTGTRESYNRDVAMYNTLETKEVVVLDADGNPKLVNADEVIDDLDNQLGELDSIMRCSRG